MSKETESWHLDTPDPVGYTVIFYNSKNDCFQLKVGDLGVHCC